MANISKINRLAPHLRTTIMLEISKEELEEQDNIGDYYNLQIGEKLYFSPNPIFRIVRFVVQPSCTCNIISCERERDGRRIPSWFNLNYLLATDENSIPMFPELFAIKSIQGRVNHMLFSCASVGYFALPSDTRSLQTKNNRLYITPLDLFEKEPFIPIKYTTGPEFGSGGFKFNYSRSLYNDNIDCNLEISGEYVNPVGPFKKYTSAYIKFTIHPSNNKANDGCICRCSYKSEFRNKYYTSDADKLCNRLINLLSDYFELHDGIKRISENDEDIKLEKHQNISYDSLPFKSY